MLYDLHDVHLLDNGTERQDRMILRDKIVKIKRDRKVKMKEAISSTVERASFDAVVAKCFDRYSVRCRNEFVRLVRLILVFFEIARKSVWKTGSLNLSFDIKITGAPFISELGESSMQSSAFFPRQEWRMFPLLTV